MAEPIGPASGWTAMDHFGFRAVLLSFARVSDGFASGRLKMKVAIIGAGQAGLATAYFLKKKGIFPVIFEAADSVGAVWRSRYASLKLFTPSQYSNLPGMPFPAPKDHYPTKDEVADYLGDYAKRFDFDIRFSTPIEALRKIRTGFELKSRDARFEADAVIVATGALQRPSIPEFSASLSPAVRQLHSSTYHDPAQIGAGRTLIVGAGNSGAQIAEELVAAGRDVSVSVEQWPKSLPQRFLGSDIFLWLTRFGIVSTQPSKVVKTDKLRAIPTIGTNLKKLAQTGQLARKPRVTDAHGVEVSFQDGSSEQFKTIIWATGFQNNFDWVEIPGTLQEGQPIHRRGVSPVDGLFFIGLPFLHSKGSAFLGFVADDAQHVANSVGALQTIFCCP
jgi:putative flavoprotein involved in K+ transport